MEGTQGCGSYSRREDHMGQDARKRAEAFCTRYGLEVPILMAPMAGACPVELAVAVADAGGMGAMGALITPPDGIAEWARAFRSQSNHAFQINIWIPQAAARDADRETRMRAFLADWGPPVPEEAGGFRLPDFEAQCEAMLEAAPSVISSIMGVFPQEYVSRLKAKGVAWFANATTLA